MLDITVFFHIKCHLNSSALFPMIARGPAVPVLCGILQYPAAVSDIPNFAVPYY